MTGFGKAPITGEKVDRPRCRCCIEGLARIYSCFFSKALECFYVTTVGFPDAPLREEAN